MRKLVSLALAASLALVATGCTTVPVAKEGSEEARVVASFQPAPDRAVVYIYWAKDSQYGVYGIPVSFGDAGEATTFITGYTRVEVEPGTYTLEAHTAELTASIEPVKLDLKPGDVRFVRMRLIARMFIGAKGELVEVPAKEAIQEIKERKLAPSKIVLLSSTLQQS